MEATKSTHEHDKHLVVHINDKPYEAPSPTMTGREIKELAGIPLGNRLYHEEHGNLPDTAVPDDAVVALRPGDHFYDLPAGVVGSGLLPSVQAQIERLKQDYPLVEVRPQADGSHHLIVGPIRLGHGWNRAETSVLVILPVGYPQARPQGFSAEANILLASGQGPSGSGVTQIGGEAWRQFCWQPSNWEHDRETLWRYVKFCERRFADVLQ